MRTISKRLFFLLLLFSGTKAFAQLEFDAQIKKMSDTLVSKLLKIGKKRVTVSNFVDLQGNTTEMGKYIAEAFSIELSNKPELIVIDRSRLNSLLEELKLTEEKLTKPENALKLGEMAGVEFIITGTTVPLDNTVDITLKALDIQNGTSIAGQRGTIPRTDAINNLLNSSLNNKNLPAANVNAGRKIDTKDKSAADVIFEVGISDMRKIECEAYDGMNTNFFGQACFENRTEYDLLLLFNGVYSLIIPRGGRICCPKINVGNNWNGNSVGIKDNTFFFKTTNTSPEKTGTFVLTLEKCKIKSVVLTKNNL